MNDDVIRCALKGDNSVISLTEIKEWLVENGIEHTMGRTIIDPATFEPVILVTIKNELNRTAFIIKWL